MSVEISDLSNSPWAGFDCIIDVRSPSEYAEDHVPGAVNMPVLDDAERARVGTIYKQDSPFAARKIGAALVARNAARAIETHMMGHGGAWRPLVYCWRGGQRSGSFAEILRQVGWRAELVEGGYRSYRRAVVAQLYDGALPHRVFRLDGYTGTAKTEVLRGLSARGVQVLDLEGLACHRGSALGDVLGPQPAQKGFESALVAALNGFDPEKPLIIEAESARIGALRLPPALWAAMRVAPRLLIEAPVAARAAYLAEAYGDLFADASGLASRLGKLRALVGHEQVEAWLALRDEGRAEALAEGLIARHYDPSYGRLTAKDATEVAGVFEAERLDAEAREDLAERVAGWVAAQ